MHSFRLFLYALVATVSLAITAAADDGYEDNNVFALELEVASERQLGDGSGWSNGSFALLFSALFMGGIAIFMGLRLSRGI